MTFGEKLKELRTKEGITQKGLGEKLNVTAQAISRWENNEVEPSISMLTTISKLFNVSVDSLLGKENQAQQLNEADVNNDVEEPSANTSEVKFIHNNPKPQKPVLAVCEACNEPIFESSDIRRVESWNKNGQREIYCYSCNEKRLKKIRELNEFQGRKKRTKSFWLGGLAAALALAIGLWLTIPSGIVSNIIYASIIGILFFPFISCLILDNNFIEDMVGTIFDWGFVRMPGLIFSLDLDGILWLLTVKLLFWIIGIILAILFGLLAVTLGLVVSLFVYPFALRKNILTPDAD